MSAPGAIALDTVAHARRERRREALTMTLYVACSLLALLLAQPGPPAAPPTPQLLFLSGCGLVGAHLLAFSVSTRLVSEGRLGAEALLLRAIQAAAGVAVTAAVALLLALAPQPAALGWAVGALYGLIGLAAFGAASAAGAGWLRAGLYVGLVWAVFAAVLAIKLAVPH